MGQKPTGHGSEPAGDPLELLDASEPGQEDDRLVVDGSGRNVAMAALGLLALLLAFVLFGGGADRSEGASPRDPGDESSNSSPAVSPTSGSTGAEGEGPAGSRSGSRPTATTLPPADAPTPDARPLILGEQSGLWLFYGGDDLLQRLDLDSGRFDAYGLRAWPVAEMGGELVMVAGNTTVGWLDVEDPSEQAQGWSSATPSPGSEPGQIWLRLNAEPSRWLLIDMETNIVLERRVFPVQALGPDLRSGRDRGLQPGPDIVTTAHGIFAFESDRDGDGGYRRVSDGRLLDFGERHALVETCAETLDDCGLVWLDRSGWRPVDLPVPEGPVRSAELLADGRWLHVIGTDRPSELLALDPDHPIGSHTLLSAQRFAVSPDGRWLATTTGDGVELVDLETGRFVERFDGFEQREGGRLLFVQQPDRSADPGR